MLTAGGEPPPLKLIRYPTGEKMSDVAATLRGFAEKWLWESKPIPDAEESLRGVEQKMGIYLPDSYRSFVLDHAAYRWGASQGQMLMLHRSFCVATCGLQLLVVSGYSGYGYRLEGGWRVRSCDGNYLSQKELWLFNGRFGGDGCGFAFVGKV
jgi:hypothetical protein